MIVFVRVLMVVVVVVVLMVVVLMVVVRWVALTGRLGRHSTPGLTVVPAAILPRTQFDEVVGGDHTKLGAEGCLVRRPVGQDGPKAGLRSWLRIGIGHATRIGLGLSARREVATRMGSRTTRSVATW